jgi:hypothetical protein
VKITAKIILIPLLVLCSLPGIFLCSAAAASTTTEVTRIYGQDRYETATKIADGLATQLNLNLSAGDKFANVVLASGNNYPDALAGAPLAKSLNAPILLLDKTPEDSRVTLKYIDAHVQKSGKVILLGGSGLFPESFKNQLLKMGFYSENIYQYGGKDSKETSLIIAKALNSKPRAIAIVSDSNFYDALTVAPLCGVDKSPVLLVPAIGLTAEQRQYLDDIVNEDVPVTVFGEIEMSQAAVDIANRYPDVDFYFNIGYEVFENYFSNRYAINSLWAHMPILYSHTPSPVIYLATGEDYPDALTGAVIASYYTKGYWPGFILLTKPDELPAETAHVLNHMSYYAKLPSISVEDWTKTLDPIGYPKVVVFGGPGAVSDNIVSRVQQILNGPGLPEEKF